MKCPVCGARFRGSRECSRCGAALEVLMRIVARAYQLRRSAQIAVSWGEFDVARTKAEEAQRLFATPSGASLALLTSWLGRSAMG